MGTAPGQPLSMVQVRETVAHLFSLGRFEGVSVDATLEDGRVALRYDLVPIHPVSRIRFAGPLGVPGIDEGALRRAVLDRYGVSPPLSRVGGHDAHPRGRAARARLPARRRSRRVPRSSTTPSARRSCSPSTRARGRKSARWRCWGRPPSAPSCSNASASRPARPTSAKRSPRASSATPRSAASAATTKRRSSRRSGSSEDDRVADLTLTVIARAARARGVHRRSAAVGPARRARPGRAGRLGRRGSARGLEQPHRRVPAGAGVSRREGAAYARGRERRAGDHLRGDSAASSSRWRRSRSRATRRCRSRTSRRACALRDGQPFSAARLDADVQLIEDLYRRRGFASAKVRSAVEIITATPPPAQVPVAVRAVITEGVRTTVDGGDVLGQSGGGGRDPSPARGAATRRAVRAGTARRGPRRASPRLSGSRLRERDRRGHARVQRRTARTWPWRSSSVKVPRCSSTTSSSSATCGRRRRRSSGSSRSSAAIRSASAPSTTASGG